MVLPLLNEEEVIPTLYNRLSAVAQSWPEDHEVIIVDDGSTDSSLKSLKEICHQDYHWKIISFSRNFGHQAAISAGIQHAAGDAVIIMDSDLQDPPEELGRFLDKWREGYEVVYAIRTKRKEGIFKKFAYASFYRLYKAVAQIKVPLDSGDFCVMDRKVVDTVCQLPERRRFVRGLRSWAGFRQIGVAYEREARFAGEVKYSFPKLMALGIDGMLSFSSLPLRLASFLGIALCSLSFVFILLLVLWWASDMSILGTHPRQVGGWTSIVSIILLLSGIQMLVIGIVGEYLARIFEEVKARPTWVLGEAIGFKEDLNQKSDEDPHSLPRAG